jgi:hypothetical protein
VLRRHPHVRDAAVVARREGQAVRALAAFVVPEQGSAAPDAASLRSHVCAHLPDWMVPAEWSVVAFLPLNVNAKVDRARLLDMRGETASRGERIAPRTPVEDLVADVWGVFLGQDSLGIDDHFFELGGHSLTALQAAFRLSEETGLALSATDILRNPTIRRLAADITLRLIEEGAADSGERVTG